MAIVLLNTAITRTYQLAVSGVIAKVRRIVNDESTTYRYSDAELIGWINDCVNAVVANIPQLFSQTVPHVCSAGARQTIAYARASQLVDLIGLTPADYASLTAFTPGWQAGASGSAVQWMRVANEPLSFFIYPPSAEGQQLTALVVISPNPLTATTDLIPLPEAYEPPIIDYVVGMAQAKDDEHVSSGRSQQFMQSFIARIKG